MLTLYFSGTGNTEYIAQSFSNKMGAECASIEADVDFIDTIERHDTICFCYPIYASRVPLIMRKFVQAHIETLKGKKIIIFATQWLFSGDGARVFTDLFPPGYIEVIYAEHFNMPNNVSNIFILREISNKRMEHIIKKADAKMTRTCQNIKRGVVKKRGFGAFSQFLGKLQGVPWQKDSRNFDVTPKTAEHKSVNSVRIDNDCTMCGICAKICPMENIVINNNGIMPKCNCTVCYRCVNACPQRAIKVMFKAKPKWQYKGVKDIRR